MQVTRNSLKLISSALPQYFTQYPHIEQFGARIYLDNYDTEIHKTNQVTHIM